LVAQEPVRLKYVPVEPSVSEKLHLKVIFTDLRKTAAALATARTMARGLGARITLMVAQVVPYPLPLAAPDVPVEFTEHLLAPMTDPDTTVEIYLCRDRYEGICHALTPDSVVILGARKWRDRHLIRALRRDGRRVLEVTV
jgi:hypothetical protein